MSTVSDSATRAGPSTPDLLAGGTFVLLGAAFAIGGSRYDVGSALRMGSGYVPIALGSILVVLGLLVVLMAFRGGDPSLRGVERGAVPWRRAGLLVAAILFFGFMVGGLGLAPTLLVTTFLVGDGRPRREAAQGGAHGPRHHRSVPRGLRRSAAAAAAAPRRVAGRLTWTASSSGWRPHSSPATS